MSQTIEEVLLTKREGGKKSLVVYLTGGLDEHFEATVEEVSASGADVIEIGIPFSDPVMDGPTIQRANDMALTSGATPVSILDRVKQIESSTPLAVMTYYNIAVSMGLERFASLLARSGVSGCILPDLPLEEVKPWADAADKEQVETILLAAPTAPDERLPLFVKGLEVSFMGSGCSE
ncbi:MAG TPA: tryptophan synthase subunit alpha [Acidimicrobiales bacterium]|nr:tryptophan synthase subunit alpha [Acidimicrobiales bacterium]